MAEITNVVESRITSTTARISFDTDDPVTPTFTYGYSASNLDRTYTGLTEDTSHEVRLNGLAHGRTVYYRIDAEGTPVTGDFPTPAWPSSSPIGLNLAELSHTAVSRDHQKLATPWRADNFTFYDPDVLPSDTDGWPTVIPSDDTGGDWVADGAQFATDTTIQVRGGTGTLKANDVITFASHSTQYRITAVAAGQITIHVGLTQNIADGEAITHMVGVRTVIHGAVTGTVIDYPTGDYRIEWEGTGELSLTVGGTVIDEGPNHKVYRVTTRTQDGIQYRILSTGTGGNHLRRLKVLEPGLWASSNNVYSPRMSIVADPCLGGFRFMDLHDTNEKADRPPAQAWTGPTVYTRGNTLDTRYTYHHFAAYGGIPYSHSVALCNGLNRPGWWCVPHLFDNASVQLMAEYLAANVRPGLKCRIEHSNETWNYTFLQIAYLIAQANVRGYTGSDIQKAAKYHGARTLEIADIFRTAFTNAGRLADLEVVLGAWAGSSAFASDALTQIGSGNWSKLKAVAIGNYIGEYLGLPFYAPTTKTWTSEQVHTEMRRHLFDTGSINTGTANEVTGVLNRLRANKTVADSAGLELWAYEGLQHLVGVNGQENDPVLTAVMLAYNRSPLVGELHAEMFEQWRAEGGKVFMGFNSVGPFTKFGSWPQLEADDDDFGANGAKMLAIAGLAQGPDGNPGSPWNVLSLDSLRLQ